MINEPLPGATASGAMPGMGGLAIAALAPVIGQAIGTGLQYNYNKKLAAQSNEYNVAMSEKAYAQNMEMLKYQNAYNSPEQQMARFKAAGLNPNLIYGQGNSGNMQSAPQMSYQSAVVPESPNMTAAINSSIQQGMAMRMQAAQLKLMESQANLTDAKVNESGIKQELMQAQTDLVNANPNLNKAYVSAMVTNLESIAAMKKQEATWRTTLDSYATGQGLNVEVEIRARGMRQMDLDLKRLEQQFNLGQADQKIKAQILESKQFQNELQRIQVEWMKNADLTPEHIRQGIMMLLQKFF